MCTVSWAVQKGGYRLLFNRDELRSRPAAEPPRLWDEPGGSFLGPRDPAGEGTWIGVNASGWTFALLNHYAREEASPPGRTSRGRIVSALAGAHSVEALEERFGGLSLPDFAPFHLLAVDPAGKGSLRTWDGRKLGRREEVERDLPVTTSSWETTRVVERRRAIFSSLLAGGPPSPDTLPAFHRHFDQTDGAASVCMRREDAETVSLCDISVGRREIVFAYFVRDPAGTGFLSPCRQTLARE
jgi:hypothetical protein